MVTCPDFSPIHNWSLCWVGGCGWRRKAGWSARSNQAVNGTSFDGGWMYPGQEKRSLKRARICPISGPGFPLERLTVEITESAFVDNLERAQTIARELKAMGCRLSLDDFGTGSSSLRHLPVMPFDELKIDRSFVASMTHNLPSRKIVAAIVGLGRGLGLIALAEGVETNEQAEILLRLGCERGQGWLYGHPLPAEELRRVIDDAPHKFSMIVTKCDASAFSSMNAQRRQWQGMYDSTSEGTVLPMRAPDSGPSAMAIPHR
jgi:hypothetical protein